MDKVLIEYNSPNGIFFQHRILDREYVVKSASHAQYEFVYLIKGEMELEVEGQKRTVSSGELIMLDINVMHSQKIRGGAQSELMVVNFLPNMLPSMVKLGFVRAVAESPILSHCLPANVASKAKVHDCFKRIYALVKKKEVSYKDIYICAEILKMLASISAAVDGLTSIQESSTKLNKTVLISKCLDYLNTNLTKKAGIDEIANNLCCSKSYLQHVFKKEVGMTISEYVNTQVLLEKWY